MCLSFDLTKLAKVTVCHHSACLLWSSTHTTTLLSEWGRNHLSSAFSLFISSPLFLALARLAASPAVLMVFTFKSTILLIEVQIRSVGNEKLPQFRPQPSAAEVAPLQETTKSYRSSDFANLYLTKPSGQVAGGDTKQLLCPAAVTRDKTASREHTEGGRALGSFTKAFLRRHSMPGLPPTSPGQPGRKAAVPARRPKPWS